MEPSWHQMQRTANFRFANRVDNQCLSFNKTTERPDITKNAYSAHEQRFVRSQSSKIKANDPEIYNVKLAKFSKRNTSQYFYLTTQRPLPCEGKMVNHGGIYYERKQYEKQVHSQTMFHSMPFKRDAKTRKEVLERIERVTRGAKADDKPKTPGQKKRACARENVELLISFLKPGNTTSIAGNSEATTENTTTKSTVFTQSKDIQEPA